MFLSNPQITFYISSQTRTFWNPTKTALFIREYQHHELLWNARHPHYRLGPARELAYEVLGRVLGKPVMSKRMVMARVRYLRHRYTLRLRQLEGGLLFPMGVTPDWFSIMSEFMPSAVRSRQPAQNNSVSPSSEIHMINQLQQHSPPCHPNTPHDGHVTATAQHSADNTLTNTSMLEDNNNPAATTESERINRQWNILQQLDRNVQQSMLEMRALAHDAAKSAADKSGPSEFESFSRNVSTQLSQMPLNDALHCQLAIQGVLQNFRLRQHPQQPHQQQQQLQQPLSSNETVSQMFEISNLSAPCDDSQMTNLSFATSTTKNNIRSPQCREVRPISLVAARNSSNGRGHHNKQDDMPIVGPDSDPLHESLLQKKNDSVQRGRPICNDLMIVDIVSDSDEDQ